MRISAKADYAVRALVHLAASHPDHPVRAESLAREQGLRPPFLLGILGALQRAHLVRSQRGAEGGYSLGRPAGQITIADVIGAIDGPLYNVRDTSLDALHHPAPVDGLADVWMAVRTSLRHVLEAVTIADLVDGTLPEHVVELAADYRDDVRPRGGREGG